MFDVFKNKVYRIIKEDFDLRMDAMVISYLMSKGIEMCQQLTEEDISHIEGNGLMTADFVQAMVRTSERIAKECSLFDDILPYIAYRFENEQEEDDDEEYNED